MLALAAAYDGAAQLSYHLEFAGPVAAIVWLPVGVGIAGLCLAGLEYWPGIVIGDLLANQYSTLPVGSAVGQTIGNVAEVVVAAYLIRRLMRRGCPLESIPGLGGLLIAIAIGTAVSATVGPLSLMLGGVMSVSEMPTVWRTWWLGDTSGALVLVPLALAWACPSRTIFQPRGRTETVLLGVALVLSNEVASRSHSPLAYVAFPALIWAALRFDPRAATLAITISAGLATWNTVHYSGVFVSTSITRSVLSVQLFIGVAALSTLCLSAVVSERERYAAGLHASRARLVKSADASRRRLEHGLHSGPQQRLVLLAVELERAADRIRRAPDQASMALDAARRQLELAIAELREFANGVHPTGLAQLGLATAMRSAAPRSAVPIQFLEVPDRRLDSTTEATAYHVFAEAIANAEKHAGASAIRVRAAAQNGTLLIEVVDDGVGGASEARGSGLVGMRDRVETLGGRLQIESPAGRGTRVVAHIPAMAELA
ncbi:MAG: MASE1 domain-containing protein [Gaiellales bacterium]